MNSSAPAAAGAGRVAIQRWSGATIRGDIDQVAGETPIALTYDRHPHVVMMATPADLEDLAVGFSLTEGLVDGPEEITAIQVLPRDGGLELALRLAPHCGERMTSVRRNLTGRSGCGLCGIETLRQALRPLAPVAGTLEVSHGAIQGALAALIAAQPLQAATGAVHAAAWCDPDGRIRAIREDVGRHNALDKLIGHRLRQGEANAGFALVSSRASYEMVFKAAAAGIELLVAVSAPTTLAIELARRYDVSLVGFARAGRHNVYHGERRLQP